MAGYVKLELRKACKFTPEGEVLKTKFVRFEWFDIAKQPELYKYDEDKQCWYSTTDYHFGKDKPTA